jgi:hypothetical protein
VEKLARQIEGDSETVAAAIENEASSALRAIQRSWESKRRCELRRHRKPGAFRFCSVVRPHLDVDIRRVQWEVSHSYRYPIYRQAGEADGGVR